jgi:hypothetical protein
VSSRALGFIELSNVAGSALTFGPYPESAIASSLRDPDERNAAAEWLRDELTDGVAHLAPEIVAKAKHDGISGRALLVETSAALDEASVTSARVYRRAPSASCEKWVQACEPEGRERLMTNAPRPQRAER